MTKNTNQRIEICWNEAREKIDILSITFQSRAKDILKDVCIPLPGIRYWLNWPKVRAQLDRIKSHFILAVRSNIAELYGLNRCANDEERLEKVKDILEGDKYVFPEQERNEGGVSDTSSLD